MTMRLTVPSADYIFNLTETLLAEYTGDAVNVTEATEGLTEMREYLNLLAQPRPAHRRKRWVFIVLYEHLKNQVHLRKVERVKQERYYRTSLVMLQQQRAPS